MSSFRLKMRFGRRETIPPLNIVPPQISGEVQVSKTLTRVPGQWVGYPPFTLALQWQADAVDIEGETGTTLVLTSDLAGAVITVTETPVEVEGDPAISDATIPVAAEGGGIAEATTLWVGKTAAGSGDGSDLANRASLSALPTIMEFLSEVAIGGEDGIVNVYSEGADNNPASAPSYGSTDYAGFSAIVISHGGTEARPILVRGVDASGDELTARANYPRMVGTRPYWALPENPEETTSTNHTSWLDAPGLFTLRDLGGNWTAFRRLSIHRTGAGSDTWGAIQLHVPTAIIDDNPTWQGLTLDHIDFYNNRRNVIQRGANGDVGQASSFWGAKDFLFRNINSVGISDKGIQLRGLSRDGVIDSCNLNGGRQHQGTNGIPIGCHFETFCRDIEVRDSVGRNFHHINGTGYWNADVWCAEETFRISFYRVEAYGCTDAGFDLKTEDGYMEDCHGEDNKWNCKTWQTMEIVRFTSIDPFKRGGNSEARHFYAGSSSDIQLYEVFASGAGRVLVAEGNQGKLHVNSGDLSGCTGTLITEISGGDVTIDPSVDLP